MKKTKKNIVLLASCLLPFLLAAQEPIPQKLSLSNCIQLALKNNLDVQKGGIQSSLAHINALQSKENLLPILNGNITRGLNEGRNIDPYTNTYVDQQVNYANTELSASLLLFNGLALQSSIRQQSLAYSAAKAREQQIKDNLSLNVVLAYLQVLTNNDVLSLSIQQKESTKKQVERLDALYQKGATSPGIYYDLKGQLASDELAVLNSKGTLENSKLTLVQLMNVYYDEHMELETLNTDLSIFKDIPDPQQLYVNAEQNLWLIKSADFTVRSTAMQIRYARSAYYPSVYLRGGVYSNFSSAAQKGYREQLDNNLGKSVYVSIAVPLFNNLRTRNAVSIAKLNNLDSKITAETVRKQLQQLIEQAYVNLLTAKGRCVTLKEQVQAFSESFKAAEVRFNLGAINSTDYVISKNNLEKAKINLVIATYDYMLRKKVIDFYEGKGIE